MDSRAISFSEIENRPTYVLYNYLNELVIQCNRTIRLNHKKEHDIKASLKKFSSLLAKLLPVIQRCEQQREPYQIDHAVYKNLQAQKKSIADAERLLENLNTDYKKIDDMLSERERQISTEITQLQSQQRTEAVRETTTHIIDLSNEESTLRDLRQKYRDKDREVESHCCGLWACNRVDIIDRADMKHQVDEAQAEIDRKRKAALRDAPKSPLDQQISDLEEALQNKRRRRFELDIVITNQCIASKSKQAELTRIEQEIAGLEQSLLQLKQQRLQPVKPSIDPRLETLTIELRSIQQQHREHVLNFPEKIKEAQQLQDNIMAKFEEKKLTEDSQEVFYNASINIASMLTILRIYVQWQAFTQQIESLFGTLRREVMDEQDALFQEITRLHVVIMTQKNNIDACFHYLWCFESRDQSLETLSIAYYRLDTATQQDLLTDQPKQTSIDGLLPVDRGLRLHQLKEHAPTTISPAPACLLESLRAKEHSMAYATALLTP